MVQFDWMNEFAIHEKYYTTISILLYAMAPVLIRLKTFDLRESENVEGSLTGCKI